MEYRPEENPEYFGTGRRPEKHPPQSATALLLLLLLGINLLPLALYRLHQATEQPAPSLTQPTEERVDFTLYDSCEAQEEDNLPGLYLAELDASQQRYLDLPEGVAVTRVEEESSAYAAGLRTGDVITAAETGTENATIKDLQTLRALLKACAPGESVTLTCNRNGKNLTVSLIISGT